MSHAMALHGSGQPDWGGHGQMTDTLDVTYFCDDDCAARFAYERGDGEDVSDRVRTGEEDVLVVHGPVTHGPPDWRPVASGDHGMTEYTVLLSVSSPYHVWCGQCGAMVSHGEGQDEQDGWCDGSGQDCAAPLTVAP